MTAWTDVITELRDDPSNTNLNADQLGDANAQRSTPPLSDTLVVTHPDQLCAAPADMALEAPEDERRRLLAFAEPVHRVALAAFVREKLGAAVVACGGEQAFREGWLGDVDREVVGAFGALGIM